MADYISSLTGPEMDAALLDMARHNSEAWAVGTRNGLNVDPSDETYHNNSKYWCEQAANYISGDVSGAVRWDVAQSLTDAQKQLARGNISAAPTASPTFTGDVSVPSLPLGDRTARAANGYFVGLEIDQAKADAAADAQAKVNTAINRTNAVNVANTDYGTYMARGEALFSAETAPTANGTIAWVYE